jgi:hypothetical protein
MDIWEPGDAALTTRKNCMERCPSVWQANCHDDERYWKSDEMLSHNHYLYNNSHQVSANLVKK